MNNAFLVAQTGPRAAQEAPKVVQERPGASQDRPKSRSGASKSVPQAVQIPLPVLAAKWGPPGARELSGGLPELILDLPRDDFPPSGEPCSRFFKAPGASSQLSCAQSLCKHTASQEYGQYSLTSLFNFYMWISTATDSRSIDR